MEPQRAVMLEHITSHDRHYDLLIGDPTCHEADSHPLWTGRVLIPTTDWQTQGSFTVTPAAHHRRRYLTYEGPISGGRGTVRRVDSGQARPVLWNPTHLQLDMQMHHFTGTLDLIRQGSNQWQAAAQCSTLPPHEARSGQ